MHGVHKLGRYWENIPRFEHRAKCADCGEEDDLKHIMLQCPRIRAWPSLVAGKSDLGQKVEWQASMARNVEHWGNYRSRSSKLQKGKKSFIRDNHHFKFLIAELAMLIWTIRIDKYKGKPLPTRDEIRAKWITKMNEKLKTDRVSTHQKFGKLATNKELVLKTWSSTLLDESNVLDVWIDASGALAGMDMREQRAQT